MLKNVNQSQQGWILNSSSGIYESNDIFRTKKVTYENYELMVLNGKIQVPSYAYNMHYRVYDEKVTLEFSLPKYIYGTNVLELCDHVTRRKSPYQLLKQGIKKVFQEIFFNVPIDWGMVELQRWDFCFNQVYQSREESLKALKYIKLKHQSKGDKLNYEHGLIQLTKSNYLKIYHKGEEFVKHDQQKYSGMYFKQIKELSERILRYEKKCTPKNVAYQYNMLFHWNHRPEYKMEYLEQKKLGKINRHIKGDFENVRTFVLGVPQIKGTYQLNPIFFDRLYYKFKDEIEMKFTIGKMSVKPLMKEVIEGKKHKVIKLKILSYIKTFKSLKRAYEMGAITKPTYYRYKKLMLDNDLSETDVRSNIYQDWSRTCYLRAVYNKGISTLNITKGIEF
jgi:hypothetical protein